MLQDQRSGCFYEAADNCNKTTFVSEWIAGNFLVLFPDRRNI